MPRPLDSILVADFSQLVQGPYATQVLADLGADVIKVEPPQGDWLRRFALGNTYIDDVSASFLAFNRNKRSIVLDLKTSEGLAAARELCARADIIVENFRPGVMEKLGLGYETVRKTNQAVVYCSSSGYGSSGPYVTRPGQDLLVQSLTGLPLLNGRKDDDPVPVAVGIADLTAGLHIVYGVLAALVGRSLTGQGSRVEVSLLNSMLSLQQQELTTYFATGVVPERSSERAGCPWIGAPFGIYRTLDGYIAISMTPANKLAGALGILGWAEETEQNLFGSRGAEFAEAVTENLLRQSTDEALDRLFAHDVWCAPVQEYADVEVDPQVLHNRMIATVPHPNGGTYRTIGPAVDFGSDGAGESTAPPLLGQHTAEVLAELGGPDLRKASA